MDRFTRKIITMAVTREAYQKYQQKAKAYLDRAGIVLTGEETANIEIADLGLGEFEQTGLALVTYVNTERVCAKELILLPGQTCRWGEMYLYVSGEPTPNPKAAPPRHRLHTYTVWHEIILRPGDQYTLPPETWHWFQGGPEGAVVSEFSTRSTDENDRFTDPGIQRAPEVID
jgi:D-lyxose ketol-isomerase